MEFDLAAMRQSPSLQAQKVLTMENCFFFFLNGEQSGPLFHSVYIRHQRPESSLLEWVESCSRLVKNPEFRTA